MKIFNDCLKISAELKAKKFFRVFFKLSSKISINSIIENRKYKPPSHWDEERQSIKLSSKCLILSNRVKPVEVKPDTDSKYAFKNEMLYMLK